MGQFSWLDCKDGSQILDNVKADVYLLVPLEFGGGHIHETCYDGYGNFGGHDVYEEVALWNRKHIENRMIKGSREYNELQDFIDGLDDAEMRETYYEDYLRGIGIKIACPDPKNERLHYPIKITHDPNAVYEDCNPSPEDPDQGWPAYDEEEGDDC